MFLRKKPPQISTLDELQQTYNDCCNLTIKNLTLEEENNVEDALKGWKSLHTSLLYKLDIFDKMSSKLNPEEKTILGELKGIRDENIKHLIRVQLRLDEVNRRKHREANHGAPPPPPPPRSTVSNSTSNINVPLTLRNSSSQSTSAGGAASRPMMKSLRPHSNGHSASSSSSLSKTHARLKPKSVQEASTAASASWTKPITSQQKYQISKSNLKSKKDDLFQDFDQDTYTPNRNDSGNWEKFANSRSSSGLSEYSNEEDGGDYNLIDLDDYNGNGSLSHSMDDLTIKPVISPKDASSSSAYTSIPAQQHHTPIQSKSLAGNANKSNGLLRPSQQMEHISKSTSDIRTKPKTPYVYTKPKPMNIQRLMRQLASQSKSSPSSSSPSNKPVTTSKVAATTAGKTAKPKPKSNITYNFVRAPAPGKLKAANSTTTTTSRPRTNGASAGTVNKQGSKQPSTSVRRPSKPAEDEQINSPTMDDLLSGYEDNPQNDLDEDDNSKNLILTNEKHQDKLIASIRGIDPTAAKQILNDVVVHGDEVYWDDIVGLEGAKNSLKEAVVYPFLRPDLFRGLREPTRGMLLFGPPGTGKTMLARAVATESNSTFFSISSSSLTSKYLGESEKLVKALFLLAKKLAPLIVFMDEIDSLLGARTEGEIESTRRIKNEFLVQWSELSSAAAGRETDDGDVSRVLILGATNLPWSIDEAARRRFVRRQYIPLPEDEARISQIKKLLKYQKNTLDDSDYNKLIELTKGFSGSDITALAKDSAMGPLRSLGDKLLSTPTEQIRPISLEDFENSLKYIRPSVSSDGLKEYEDWALKFGSSGA